MYTNIDIYIYVYTDICIHMYDIHVYKYILVCVKMVRDHRVCDLCGRNTC